MRSKSKSRPQFLGNWIISLKMFNRIDVTLRIYVFNLFITHLLTTLFRQTPNWNFKENRQIKTSFFSSLFNSNLIRFILFHKLWYYLCNLDIIPAYNKVVNLSKACIIPLEIILVLLNASSKKLLYLWWHSQWNV